MLRLWRPGCFTRLRSANEEKRLHIWHYGIWESDKPEDIQNYVNYLTIGINATKQGYTVLIDSLKMDNRTQSINDVLQKGELLLFKHNFRKVAVIEKERTYNGIHSLFSNVTVFPNTGQALRWLQDKGPTQPSLFQAVATPRFDLRRGTYFARISGGPCAVDDLPRIAKRAAL